MSEPGAPLPVETGAERGAWIGRLGAMISFVVPFAVALGAAGVTSTWRDDAFTLPHAAACAGGANRGIASALLAQVAVLLPFGTVHFRLALTAAVVLGAAAWSVRRWARDLLTSHAQASLLSEALSTIAALTATLSAFALGEGAVAGGGGLALLLAATILGARPGHALRRPGDALYLGVLTGMLIAESGVVAMALVAAVALALVIVKGDDEHGPAVTPGAASRASRGDLEGASAMSRARGEATLSLGESLAIVWGTAVASRGILALPAIVRRFATNPVLDVGRALFALEGPSSPPSFGGVWARLNDDGVVLVALGALGLAFGLAQKRLRGASVALAVLVLFYALSGFVEGRLVTSEEVAPLRLVAVAALAVGVALALQTVAVTLLAWRLPMARGAAILLVMTDLTLAVATAEEATFANDRSAWRGADAFTDEALETLPPRSVLLVRSRETALRVWAAQLAQGTRPDVLVVPVPATGDTRLALRLLRAEPALQKALQDISLERRPGEEALTILADARPVLVELDVGWDRRVYSHFVPDHLWLRFLPEPRGPSDRKTAFADLVSRAERVHAASLVGGKPDAVTARVLRARLVDGALLAALLGDRDDAAGLAARIGAIPGGELFSAELVQKLSTSKSGPIDVKGLLR